MLHDLIECLEIGQEVSIKRVGPHGRSGFGFAPKAWMTPIPSTLCSGSGATIGEYRQAFHLQQREYRRSC